MIIMKDCPRWTLLNLLLKLQTGGHIKSKYVEYLKVSVILLNKSSESSLGCDCYLARVEPCSVAVLSSCNSRKKVPMGQQFHSNRKGP